MSITHLLAIDKFRTKQIWNFLYESVTDLTIYRLTYSPKYVPALKGAVSQGFVISLHV